MTIVDADKSCSWENDSWVPWIVMNIDEMIDRLRALGYSKFLITKNYEIFGGSGMRYLEKDLYSSKSGSARSTVLAIKDIVSNKALS